MSNWTRDAAGEYVDWTKPPYRHGGRLCLLLEGETWVHPDELRKRRAEYLKLTRRAMGIETKDAPTERSGRGVGDLKENVNKP